jgi:hypothetical protein
MRCSAAHQKVIYLTFAAPPKLRSAAIDLFERLQVPNYAVSRPFARIVFRIAKFVQREGSDHRTRPIEDVMPITARR